MPRGSRPGERRGGRQRGTPNKKTLIKNAVFCAAASNPNQSPLDFMLALMRDPQVPIDLRMDMAAAAAPFVHARPRPPSHGRPHPMELRARRAKAAASNGGEDGAVPGGEENPTLQPVPPGADENPLHRSFLAGTKSPRSNPTFPAVTKNPPSNRPAPGGHEKPTLQPALPARPERAEPATGGRGGSFNRRRARCDSAVYVARSQPVGIFNRRDDRSRCHAAAAHAGGPGRGSL